MTVSTITKVAKPAGVSPGGITIQSRAKRNAFVLIGIIAIFQVFALLAIEGVLYLAGIGEEDISTTDRELGFRHRENKRVTWRQEGYSQGYFGVDGLRAPALPAKQPGVMRIMLLGDSFIEGLQEPYEHSFGEQLEAQLSHDPGKPVEVLNFGTVGYSTVQEYLLLKRMISKYRPDAVMLCYTPRDMAETLETWAPEKMKPIGSRPYALKMPGKAIEISNAPVLNSLELPSTKWWSRFEWFKQNSRIWGFFSINKPKVVLKNSVIENVIAIAKNPSDGFWQLIKPVMSGASPSFQIQFFEENQKKKDALRQERVMAEVKKRSDLDSDPNGIMRTTHLKALDDTFGELLTKMGSLCASNQSKLYVLFTPCRSQLLPPSPSVPAPAPALYNVTYPEEIAFVTKHCKQLGVPFIDCHTAAAKLAPQEIEKLFFVHHPTRIGNKFLSERAAQLLRTQY